MVSHIGYFGHTIIAKIAQDNREYKQNAAHSIGTNMADKLDNQHCKVESNTCNYYFKVYQYALKALLLSVMLENSTSGMRLYE